MDRGTWRAGEPMTPTNLLFVILGAAALMAGVVVLVTAIRGGTEDNPRNSMLLIGGMMLAAFGLVLGGFAVAYSTAAPLEANAGAGA